MKITGLKCNHMTDPLGFALGAPSLSWKTADASGRRQDFARVEIAADSGFADIIFDSGKTSGADCLAFQPDISLQPRRRYFWRVRVWDETGDSAMSDAAWFETGKMDEPWRAGWISAGELRQPVLRREFESRGGIVSARIYASAVGQYELYLNGRPVSAEVLAPGYTNYDNWIQYQTYDVTGLMRSGGNTLFAMLGGGWSEMVPRIVPPEAGCCGENGRFFIAEMHILYSDGSEQIICTDSRWKMCPSPLLESSIYNGETWDDRLFFPEYSLPGFDDGAWLPVIERAPRLGRLTERLSPPVKIMERLHPAALLTTPSGESVLDMGQNMVGWLEMTVDIPAGETLFIQFGEILQDGEFYNGNLMEGRQEFRFISSGRKRTVRQFFTYYGFRYARLECSQPLDKDMFTGLAVYSDLERTGDIRTSDPLINRLFQNCLWSQKGNFIDNPSDCPQRSERLGWTGDAQVFCGTACYNMDCAAFYAKYIHDMNLEQPHFGGAVPHVVPSVRGRMAGAAGWADAVTIIPWTVYLHTGDKQMLRSSYAGMAQWVDYITSNADETGLWTNGSHFGDWLGLDGIGMRGGTDDNYLANCYYLISASIAAKAAAILGRSADSLRYGELARSIRRAIQREYFTPSGRLAVETQTGAIYALLLELYPEGCRQRMTGMLKELLDRYNGQLRTGFLGTPYICRMLSENGMNEDAYTLITNARRPGWLFSVAMGATTIWENWYALDESGHMTGSYSLNHYSYGAVVEWMYRDMLGIVPDEAAPGFRHFFLTPRPNRHIASASGSVDTVSGLIESAWEIDPCGRLHFSFTVPFNTTATLTLPDVTPELLSGVHAVSSGSGCVIELTAGHFEFSYMPTASYILTYGVWTSVGDIMADPSAKAALTRALADTPEEMLMGLAADPDASLRQALNFPGPVSMKPVIRAAEDALSKVPYPRK